MSELRLEKLSYRYKNSDRDAVRDVSCRFSGGYLNAVIGPSGSGKTTLLSLMAGLDKATSGEIYVDGEPLSKMDLDSYRRSRISMIFQAFQLFPLLTVRENVSFPMELNGVAREKAEARAGNFLTSLGIGREKHKRFPAHLSGGEQQRVAIARSLASGARILLADEPTGNLDTANGERILDILKMLAHEQQYCVIVVTHDLDIAAGSDRVWRMSDGMLRAENPGRRE